MTKKAEMTQPATSAASDLPERFDLRSHDIAADKIAELLRLFPETRTEDGKIDFDRLRLALGETVDVGKERFGLNWPGKADCFKTIQAPSMGTLRPAPDQSVNWDTTENMIIEGDNLEVLKLLQKSYLGKVKMIYIDPPYNTGNDFIYPNNYSESLDIYLAYTGQADSEGRKFGTNTEADGRFHSKWMSMMYSRLMLARNLLTPDGVLVCTIDENEQVNLGALLREVFPEGLYEQVCVTIVHNPRGVQGTNFSYTHEYAFFVFPSGIKAIGDRKLKPEDIQWSQLRNWGSESERADARNCFYPILVKDGQIIGFGDVCPDDFHPTKQTERKAGVDYVYPIDREGIERKWRYARQSVEAIRHLLRVRQGKEGLEVEIGKDFGMYRTVWADKRFDANEYGTQIVNDLVPDSPFSFPKSLWAVYDTLYAVVGEDTDAIVLDFFAGSGTTGHAVLEMNRMDGGSRRFILVQLPEPIDNHKRYKTIADVTKTRIRSVCENLIADAAGTLGGIPAGIDLGFRVYKLAESNFKPWEADTPKDSATLAQQMELHIEHIRQGRSGDDLFFEILLKSGFPLTTPVETLTLADKKVYSVASGALLVCLERELTLEAIRAMAKLKPERVVCLDAGFAKNDQLKANAVQEFRNKGVTSFRTV